jgi:hypothetical protein
MILARVYRSGSRRIAPPWPSRVASPPTFPSWRANTGTPAWPLPGRGNAVSFYADIPYATEFGWPAWVRAVEPEPFLDVDVAWSENLEPILAAGWQPKVVTLDEAGQQRKIEAMRTYRTQFAGLEPDGQRRLTHPDLVRHEVVWIRPTS